jgi:uncharacterized protein
MSDTTAKERVLEGILGDMRSAVVAFSGGVDSAYLAVTASRVLGPRALAVTAESPSYPRYQKDIALRVAEEFGLRHEFLESREMEDPSYRSNPVNRCYFCKHELYTRLGALALERGFGNVIDGNNLDDTGDYRPGRAAGETLSVRSPLIEAGLGKTEIRALSRRRGLGTWDLPAAACLSSRIPYGSPVTVEKLRMIEEAEAYLRGLGFPQTRVRHHDEIARIEMPREDLGRFLDLDTFDRVVSRFRELGFRYVSLDLEGYRSGRLNEALDQTEGGPR